MNAFATGRIIQLRKKKILVCPGESFTVRLAKVRRLYEVRARQEWTRVWVFIAQLVEHCSANAEATGSNPVEAPKNVLSGYFEIA